MKKQPPPPNEVDADGETERLLVEYLRHTGALIPQTSDEVSQAEARLKSEGGEAPERLRRLKIACGIPAKVFKFPSAVSTTEAHQYLARAAREGKKISEAVEEQMKRDRAKAERDANGKE